MTVHVERTGYSISGLSAAQTGSALDTRACYNYGYLFYKASAESGIFNLEGAHDLTAWMVIGTYTATATQTGTAQIAGYFPYVRANLTSVFSGASKTGIVWVHYAGGIQ